MAMEFYTTVAKRLKLKVTKFLGLIPTFAEVTGKELAGGGLFAPLPLILNRVKTKLHLVYKYHKDLLSTLLKRSKQNYFKQYFESNLNNSKST